MTDQPKVSERGSESKVEEKVSKAAQRTNIEAQNGMPDLVKQKQELIKFLKNGGKSGISLDFGKPFIDCDTAAAKNSGKAEGSAKLYTSIAKSTENSLGKPTDGITKTKQEDWEKSQNTSKPGEASAKQLKELSSTVSKSAEPLKASHEDQKNQPGESQSKNLRDSKPAEITFTRSPDSASRHLDQQHLKNPAHVETQKQTNGEKVNRTEDNDKQQPKSDRPNDYKLAAAKLLQRQVISDQLTPNKKGDEKTELGKSSEIGDIEQRGAKPDRAVINSNANHKQNSSESRNQSENPPLSALAHLKMPSAADQAESQQTDKKHKSDTYNENGNDGNFPNIQNSYHVTEGVYRGANPGGSNDQTHPWSIASLESGLQALKAKGISTVVDFESPADATQNNDPMAPFRIDAERLACQALGMKFVSIPMTHDGPTQQQLNQFSDLVKQTQDSGENLYCHCREGRDRTGLMIAYMRESLEHEPFKDAAAEDATHGHKDKWPALNVPTDHMIQGSDATNNGSAGSDSQYAQASAPAARGEFQSQPADSYNSYSNNVESAQFPYQSVQDSENWDKIHPFTAQAIADSGVGATDQYNLAIDDLQTNGRLPGVNSINDEAHRDFGNATAEIMDRTEYLRQGAASGVDQGKWGDCWFQASVASFAQTPGGPEAIQNMISLNSDGSYKVVFPGDLSQPITVSQGDIQSDGLYDSAQWSAVLEAAIIKASPNLARNGSYSSYALNLLTGQPGYDDYFNKLNWSDQQLLGRIENSINSDQAITASSYPSYNSAEPVENLHYYSLVQFQPNYSNPAESQIWLRNPWGENIYLGGNNVVPVGEVDEGVNNLGGGMVQMSLSRFRELFNGISYTQEGDAPSQTRYKMNYGNEPVGVADNTIKNNHSYSTGEIEVRAAQNTNLWTYAEALKEIIDPEVREALKHQATALDQLIGGAGAPTTYDRQAHAILREI